MSHEAPQIMEKGWCVVGPSDVRLDPRQHEALRAHLASWAGGAVVNISTHWTGNEIQQGPFETVAIPGLRERLLVMVRAIGSNGEKLTRLGTFQQGMDGSIVNKQELGLPDDLDPELIWTLGGVQREYNQWWGEAAINMPRGEKPPEDPFVHISVQDYDAQVALLAAPASETSGFPQAA